MKRYVKSTIPFIKIVVDVADSEVKISATGEFKEMTHPSIRRKYKRSDEWLREINDVVRSIIGSMKGRKFNIIKAYPSKKSYTYYIRFQPTDKEGNLWDQVLEFQIELRDHTSESHSDIGEVKDRLLVRTYYVDDKRYDNAYQLMQEVWELLDQLQLGDFSGFIR